MTTQVDRGTDMLMDLYIFRDMFKRAGQMQFRPNDANYYVLEKGYVDKVLRDTRHWLDSDPLTLPIKSGLPKKSG